MGLCAPTSKSFHSSTPRQENPNSHTRARVHVVRTHRTIFPHIPHDRPGIYSSCDGLVVSYLVYVMDVVRSQNSLEVGASGIKGERTNKLVSSPPSLLTRHHQQRLRVSSSSAAKSGRWKSVRRGGRKQQASGCGGMDQATVKVVLRVKPKQGDRPTDSVTVVDNGEVRGRRHIRRVWSGKQLWDCLAGWLAAWIFCVRLGQGRIVLCLCVG